MEYKNQYLGLPKEQKLRTTFEIDIKDIAILRSYDPKEGTLQTTASILFKKLIHELKQSSVQLGDFSSYQHAIRNTHIILGVGYQSVFTINGIKYHRVDETIVPDVVQRVAAPVPPTGTKRARASKTPRGDVGRGASSVAQPLEGA